MKRQILLGVLILLTIQTLAVAGDTYYVPSRDYPTIQSAINATLPANDDVVVVAPGVYTGAGNVNLDFGGRAITVRSEINPDNPEPGIIAATIIDCQRGARAFILQSGEGHASVIDGFTIINGSAVVDPNTPPNTGGTGGNGQNAYGGAIACFYDPVTGRTASPTISNCVIKDCIAQGQNGEDAWYIFDPFPPPDPPPDALDPLEPLPDPGPNVPGQPGLPGDDGVNGPDGAPGASFDGGDGGIGYGGALYFAADSSPIIWNCTIINCQAIGGNGGFGGQGQDGQDGGDGQDGQAGQAGQNGGPPLGVGGAGGPGGNGGNGGHGGDGGDGEDGGDGDEALGGAIYFGPDCQPTIRYCTIMNSSTTQGLGNIGGNGGDGGVGGVGGAGGDGGAGGTPDGNGGAGGNGGNGGNGANGGHGGSGSGNGSRSWGGAIFYGANCVAVVSDTVITNSTAHAAVPTGTYASGVGGDPNTGGEGGAGGAGGSGTGAGESGEDGVPGGDGLDGIGGWSPPPSWSWTTSFGGGDYYDVNCTAELTRCKINYNSTEPTRGPWWSSVDGGGEYYKFYCNAVLNSCKFIGNYAGYDGGGQCFDWSCAVEVNDCKYAGNYAVNDGGGLKCRSDATLTNCSFGGNRADSDNNGWGYGGAIDAYLPGTTLIIDVNNCSFSGNQAIYGGGFSSENFEANFTDCYFTNNTARAGGGLDLVNGNISVTGGVVKGNNATDGDGGGFNCRYTIAEIRDCTISDNSADGVYPAGGSGGAINFDGGASTQVVFNCLLTGNSASVDGGAIFCLNAAPQIGNCTFSGNSAGGGYGGAIFSNWSSDPQITDAIFQNNNSHAIHEEDSGGDALVTFSLFYGNPDGDYYDSGTGLTYTGAGEIGSIPGGSNNLYGNPLFVSGPLGGFYLNQTLSPAINAGSDTALSLGLNSYTTDAANALDSGQVDRGYHYPDITTVAQYQLSASVVEDEYGNTHGSISPTSGTYYAGTVVTLTATPDAGWRVKTWSGTDDDSSTATTNSVVMNSDRTATVEFEQPKTLIVAIGGGEGYYSNIQDAVCDTKDGDTIVVYPGIYYGGYFGVSVYVDKSITIRSMHPDDPCYVAATIIDGYNEYQFNEGYNNLGVTFGPHTNANTILNGFTIQNCGGYWGDGLDGTRTNPVHPDGWEGGMGSGAAIRVSSGGGPIIKNCVIRDNLVIGGNGGNGVGADTENNAGRGGWGGWAYGGAIYCSTNSSPTFINCQIIDNYAQGGSGGDGGDDVDPGGMENYGGIWSMDGTPEYPVLDIDPYSLNITYVIDGGLWEVWGYVGDYRWYSAYGGGVFCDTGSNVTFTHCTISGNYTYGGMSGQGGENAITGRPIEPLIPYTIPSFGGGVYCAAEATVTFTGCTIADNLAFNPNDPNHHLDPYLGHGGGVCAEDTATVIFTDCTFSENEAAVGGGIHFADANPQISECNFTYNSAYRGGGLFGEHGPATILRSNFTNNIAFSDPNDPNVLGEGGGLHFWATEADIIDCNISSNQAEASGGGVYFGGEGVPSLLNCLVTNNTAGRDGGGVSANIFTQLTVFNCTIADNIVTGVGYGGGVYGSYGSYTNIVDSIIWGNSAYYGPQIGIGITVSPSTVEVSDSDVQGAQSDAYVEDDCSLIWDPNNLYTDPLFVVGPLGDYYLSQIAAGQLVDSLCVDAGSSSAISVGMSGYTTRTDELFDRGIVDMGYHHLITLEIEECRVVDLFLDHFINFKDFAVFAWNWLSDDCSDDNGWCDGADLTFDENVDWEDLEFYIGCWLVVDNDTPLPNPSEWAIEPYSSSLTSISMVAKTTDDTWGGDVEYYFECVYGDCNDSGWQSDPCYTDDAKGFGLDPNTEYGYRVRAKDSRCGDISDLNCTFDPNDPNDPNAPNKTDWSDIRYAITGEEAPDTDPPSPAPVISSYSATSTSITLSATTASDESGVQYYFEDVNAPAFNSGWIANPTWTDVNLAADTMYTYRVKASDESLFQNETGWSPSFDATTLAEGEEPNEPNEPPLLQAPVTVSANQVEVGFYWHHIITAQATAEDPLYFRFVCLNQSIFNSAWVPRVGPAVETFDHPVLPFEMPNPTITRGSDVITYDIALGDSWNLWEWKVCGSNEEDYDPALCSAPVAMPQPP